MPTFASLPNTAENSEFGSIQIQGQVDDNKKGTFPDSDFNGLITIHGSGEDLHFIWSRGCCCSNTLFDNYVKIQYIYLKQPLVYVYREIN